MQDMISFQYMVKVYCMAIVGYVEVGLLTACNAVACDVAYWMTNVENASVLYNGVNIRY